MPLSAIGRVQALLSLSGAPARAFYRWRTQRSKTSACRSVSTLPPHPLPTPTPLWPPPRPSRPSPSSHPRHNCPVETLMGVYASPQFPEGSHKLPRPLRARGVAVGRPWGHSDPLRESVCRMRKLQIRSVELQPPAAEREEGLWASLDSLATLGGRSGPSKTRIRAGTVLVVRTAPGSENSSLR